MFQINLQTINRLKTCGEYLIMNKQFLLTDSNIFNTLHVFFKNEIKYNNITKEYVLDKSFQEEIHDEFFDLMKEIEGIENELIDYLNYPQHINVLNRYTFLYLTELDTNLYYITFILKGFEIFFSNNAFLDLGKFLINIQLSLSKRINQYYEHFVKDLSN